MKYRSRIYYSDTQKALMWDHWQKGESLHDIARLFDRGHSSIQRILRETGGIRPRERKRSRLSLTLSEREVISRGLARGLSMRDDSIPTWPVCVDGKSGNQTQWGGMLAIEPALLRKQPGGVP